MEYYELDTRARRIFCPHSKKKIFLINILMQMENIIPDNTIYLYQLRNWQFDLADIIEFYIY